MFIVGKIFPRAYGSINVPDHLNIIEMVSGLTELVPKSKGLKKNTETSKEKRGVEQTDPLGVIYPGILRKMYDLPSQFPVNPNSSLGLIEFQSDQSFTFFDLNAFNEIVSENVTVNENNIIGQFGGSDGESSLDVQVNICHNSNIFFLFFTP